VRDASRGGALALPPGGMELWVSPISGRTSARSESRGLKHRAGSDAQEGGDTASGKARTLHGGVADQRTRQHDGPSAGVGGDLGDPQIVARGAVGERRGRARRSQTWRDPWDR
jgi:hypothetical protein